MRGAVLLRWFGGGLTVPQWSARRLTRSTNRPEPGLKTGTQGGSLRALGTTRFPASCARPIRERMPCPRVPRLVLLTLRVLYQPRRVLILLANFVRRSSIRPTAPAQRRSEKTKRARQPRSSTPGGGVIRQSSRVPAMRALEGWLGRANVSATRWPPSLLSELRFRVGRILPLTSADSFARQVPAGTGITRFHAHQLRHSFACRWLEAGGSLAALQGQLGTLVGTPTLRRTC